MLVEWQSPTEKQVCGRQVCKSVAEGGFCLECAWVCPGLGEFVCMCAFMCISPHYCHSGYFFAPPKPLYHLPFPDPPDPFAPVRQGLGMD